MRRNPLGLTPPMIAFRPIEHPIPERLTRFNQDAWHARAVRGWPRAPRLINRPVPPFITMETRCRKRDEARLVAWPLLQARDGRFATARLKVVAQLSRGTLEHFPTQRHDAVAGLEARRLASAPSRDSSLRQRMPEF